MRTIIITLLLLSQLSMTAQEKIDFPIGGNWYCPKTDQLFMFQPDKDMTIKGRGVHYNNGTGKIVQMQIMSQDKTPIESGEYAYYVLTYDPAKPKTIYKLVTYPGDKNLVLKMTEPNNPKKAAVIFYRLQNMQPASKHNEDN
jgi:hypothetical protein